MKPIVECVRDYIMEYPDLKDGYLLVDFLGSKAIEYSIESVPCNPVFKQYTDGGRGAPAGDFACTVCIH